MFWPASIKVNRNRSRIGNVFPMVRLFNSRPGPSSTFAPPLPNRPGAGTVKHDASNHRLILRCAGGRLPLHTRSGRPLAVLVLDGSEPEKLGEKNWPVSK